MTKPNLFQSIAQRCNVSPASVTLALQDSPRISEETKLRVYLTARELGYRNSKVKGGKHLQFAIFHGQLLPLLGNSGSSQFEIWYGISQALNQLDATLNIYELSLKDGEWDFSSLPGQFKRDQFDGIIVTGVPGNGFLRFLNEISMPTVLASNTEVSVNVDQVCFDYARAARTGVESALARGKRRIGFVSPGAEVQVHRALLRGYREAMEDAGCFEEAYVATTKEFHDHNGSLPEQLFARCPEVEAIFATNGRSAHQCALTAALHQRAVPEGVEIISIQSELHRELRYRQTVIHADFNDLGRRAVAQLLERRENPAQPASTLLLRLEVHEA